MHIHKQISAEKYGKSQISRGDFLKTLGLAMAGGVIIGGCGGGSGSGGSRSSAKITMTMEGDYLFLHLAGSGVATVDWGDGSEVISRTLSEFDFTTGGGVEFEHRYHNSTIRTITINGDNITFLNTGDISSLDVSRCAELTVLLCGGSRASYDRSGQLTRLDVSKNTALTLLGCNNSQLTSSALNALFRTLHSNQGEKNIYINGNPGTNDSDRSIAERKGWTVHWQ